MYEYIIRLSSELSLQYIIAIYQDKAKRFVKMWIVNENRIEPISPLGWTSRSSSAVTIYDQTLPIATRHLSRPVCIRENFARL